MEVARVAGLCWCAFSDWLVGELLFKKGVQGPVQRGEGGTIRLALEPPRSPPGLSKSHVLGKGGGLGVLSLARAGLFFRRSPLGMRLGGRSVSRLAESSPFVGSSLISSFILLWVDAAPRSFRGGASPRG